MQASFQPRLTDIDFRRRSPNHGPRVAGYTRPDCVVLHYTGMRDASSAVDRLCDPASSVSCHYVVTEPGGILQLVDEAERAWCCGRSYWQGVTDLNSASVNIEIVNGGHDYGLPPYPEPQVGSVIRLCRDIVDRHGIAANRVLAHSDIAPARKQDPGERFPWDRLASAGLGAWPSESEPEGVSVPLQPGEAGAGVATLQADLARLGYGIAGTGVYDSETATVVRAFQRHFRPRQVDGVADGDTLSRLTRLLTGASA